MKPIFIVALVGAIAFLFGGCDRDYGYLELKTQYRIRDGDVYMSGNFPLKPNAAGQIDTVVRLPVGTAGLVVQRGETVFPLCPVTIRKDRVVSVTLSRGRSDGPCDIRT